MSSVKIKPEPKTARGTFWSSVVLWFPLALFPIAVFGAGRYPLVLREDTVSPIVGAPRSLVYLSPAVAIAYFVLIFFVSRQQVSKALHSKIPKASGLLFTIPLTLLFTVWGAGQALNGLLDFSQPRMWQTRIIGPAHIRSTSYIEVQDWKDAKAVVYLMGGPKFLQSHPIGSTLRVMTREGLFGYEWYA
jgi:hypothetical protein